MYIPPFSAVEDESEARKMVADAGSGWLVTTGDDGLPTATLLPLLWRDSTVIAHMAKANPHWPQIIDEVPCVVLVNGPQAYISPSWYPSKQEHGRVVPTWNYLAVQLTGTVRVHQSPDWLRRAVIDLTDHHELKRDQPWAVTDAPADFIDGQLKAIVGLEITVNKVEAKAKLSQNRAEADRAGVIEGLGRDPQPGAAAIAATMRGSAPVHRA